MRGRKKDSASLIAATAIVLAGGESRRMKRDKALLPVGGEPLLRFVCRQLEKIFADILVSASEPGKYEFLGFPVVVDGQPGIGPLMAMLSALEASHRELNFIAACDIPLLDARFIRRLHVRAGGGAIVVPRHADGKLEPLFAFYPRRAMPVMRQLLDRGIRKIAALYDHYPTHFVSSAGQSWLANVNTASDYRRLLQRLGLATKTAAACKSRTPRAKMGI